MSIKYDEIRVKRPLQEMEYEPWQIEELLKCKEDIFYFLKYVKIVHPGKGEIHFVPYEYQIKLLEMIKDEKFVCALQSRQSGKTAVISVFSTWYSLFNNDKVIGIVANKERSAKMILGRIKRMYESIPPFLKPGVKSYNELSVTFDNNTRIIVSATSPDALRGESLAVLFMDEFAFVPQGQATAFYSANYPTISASEDGKIVIASTPNGMYNLFHKIYTDSENGKNAFKHIKVSWEDVPGRNEKWKEEQLMNMTQVQFDQEFAVKFIGSTNTVIDPTTLEKIINSYKNPILTDLNGKFRIYEKPKEECRYVLGVDQSKGSGEHNSTIQVLKVNSTKPVDMEQVAVFEDNYTDIYQFSAYVHRIAIYYNNAYIVVENNAEGAVVVNQLWWEYEYPNLVNTGTKAINLGVRATKKTKPEAVLLMKKLIEDESLKLVDENTLNELSDFVEKSNGGFGAKNTTDDLVSALYWAVYILKMNVYDDFRFRQIEKNEEEDVWGILTDIGNESLEWEFKDLFNIH